MRKFLFSAVVLAMGLSASGCGALQPPDAGGPRANLPPYPILLPNEATRVEEASLAWRQLSQRYGLPDKVEADLQPLTATVQSLPKNLSRSILLPKVGAGAIQTEEETRESLRRFIVEWRQLIGADPAQLSLVERTDDEPTGVKLARYEQRPFRYPLRGGFGNLIIRFRSDRTLVDLSSNCLPNSDRLQAALAGLIPKVTWEDALNQLKGGSITIPDSTGGQKSLSLPTTTPAEVRQLVVYALPSTAQQNALELHLAWEIGVAGGDVKTIYLDAIADRIIATSQM